MSEETTAGDAGMTEEQQQGIFAQAAEASAKGEAPAGETPVTTLAATEPPAEEKSAEEKSAEEKPLEEKPAETQASTPTPTPTPAPAQNPTQTSTPTPNAAEEAAKPIIDDAAKALADMEFDDPASGEGAKITAANLEKEYPSVTGYTRALVAKALEIQSQAFEKKLAQALNADPTISRIRQQEIEEQTAKLLDSVAQGDDGISNAADIQRAAIKANWVASQSEHIQNMALHSNDPRDVRYVLERAAADLKIELKRGTPSATPKAKPTNNQKIALQSTLRGTGRQATATRSDNPQTAEEAEALFNETAANLRAGKSI